MLPDIFIRPTSLPTPSMSCAKLCVKCCLAPPKPDLALYSTMEKEAYPLRIALEELGHHNPPPRWHVTDTVKQKWSKAIDMRFYWIRDRVRQAGTISNLLVQSAKVKQIVPTIFPASTILLLRTIKQSPRATYKYKYLHSPFHIQEILRGTILSVSPLSDKAPAVQNLSLSICTVDPGDIFFCYPRGVLVTSPVTSPRPIARATHISLYMHVMNAYTKYLMLIAPIIYGAHRSNDIFASTFALQFTFHRAINYTHMETSSSRTSIFTEPSLTRLVTIIAQVDHGKTTLADSLIESNGIISERLAGTLRYLDDLQEEQRRGITMRTSAIGLSHLYQPTNKQQRKQKQQRNEKEKDADNHDNQQQQKFVLHLLDSPGHTDFSSEVSSALQCCDSALLVVDAVEGMCARTHQVLREAFVHQLVPILVINKVDRLCTELCLTEAEAYLRLRKLLESMNAASAAMLNSSRAEASHDQENSNERDESIWTFTEANVVFGSALYGWGFTVPSLARHLFRTKQLEIKPAVLRQYLFGDFKFKNGKVLKWKPEQADDLPMFSEFALRPLWQIYQGVSQASLTAGLGSNLFGNTTSTVGGLADTTVKISATTNGMERVQRFLSFGASNQSLADIMHQTGSATEDTILRAVLRRYRPLSDAVLNAVCETGPSPQDAARTVRTRALALQPGADAHVAAAVANCDTAGPVVAHVCKFLSTSKANLMATSRNVLDDSTGDTLLVGVARVLSGVLKTNSTYHCMGPKHDPSAGEPAQRMVRLFLLMGSSLLPVEEVPAGHLCAIYGLEDLQLKTVTLSSSKDAMPIVGFDRGIRPLVKVNVEPENAEDAEALERGLIKLSLADAAVEVTATAKGERILACLGEIHLEQSLLDLETVYCGREIKLRKSEPIVEFGETTEWLDDDELDYNCKISNQSFFGLSPSDLAVLPPPLRHTTIPPYNEEEGINFARRGRMRALLSGKTAAIGVRVVPLADAVYQSLKARSLLIDSREEVLKLGKSLGCDSGDDVDAIFTTLLTALQTIDANGNALIESKAISSGVCVKGIVGDEVYSRDHGQNNHTDVGDCEPQGKASGMVEYAQLLVRMRECGGALSSAAKSEDSCSIDHAALDVWRTQMSGSLVAGFQLGLRAGPVCEEPVHRVLIVLESVEVAFPSNGVPSKSLSGGMVIGALKQGIRCSLLSRPARLMERHLKLTLHSSFAALGSLYAVLSKRRGRVLEDSMVDGTDLLLITATLPQAESYGLAPELFRKTSGEVTVPELTFWGWQRLDEDPFWIPTSLEEREDFGEIEGAGDSSTGVDNTALKYIRLVRERKGLLVDSAKTVMAAEKQRTMKR